MDEAYLIVDVAESDNWTNGPFSLCRIPPEKRPTVVQATREVAEKEALRLQALHPHGRFVLFAASAVTVLLETPTHVNLKGEAVFTEKVARLVEIHHPNEIPF